MLKTLYVLFNRQYIELD